jgi:sporulation protein YlmC with PRC-barrel domain
MKKIFTAASLAALMAFPAFAQDATTPNPASPSAPVENAAPAPAPAPSADPAPAPGPAPATEAAPSAAPDSAIPDKSAENSATPDKAAGLGSEVAASDLLSQKVTNAENEAVGDINDLSIGSDGKIAAVIIGVGGFLGMGEKNVSVPYDQLSFSRDANGYLVVTANITKEGLQSAPEWKKPDAS